ncbi:RES family NAD+ phosphorylase [Candidatus Burkholderia verschuerenii]|uniref:RES family NAD+ phosphorylase n=1 Tax=Candidatus Burkholderia verschuerenii TaxID=242163 RepID=UPI0009F968E1|nr:RES family NAD+ phosphorylase [Candidatus Burkholderia verschuerenii]
MTITHRSIDWRERWPRSDLDWSPAYRVIPTRFPAVNLFDRVASAQDFEALYALEAMTNDRLRTEVGELDLVPADERCFGPGCGPIMAAFTHLNPSGSRFSDGSYGVFYCARGKSTAIAETRYHSGLFLAATKEAPLRTQMRLYTVTARGEVIDDLRAATSRKPASIRSCSIPTTTRSVARCGAQARRASRIHRCRDTQGECLAARRTTMLHDCRHAAYLEYNWNGETIDYVFELNQVG